MYKIIKKLITFNGTELDELTMKLTDIKISKPEGAPLPPVIHACINLQFTVLYDHV